MPKSMALPRCRWHNQTWHHHRGRLGPPGTNTAPTRRGIGATWGVFPNFFRFFFGGGRETEMMVSIENIGIYGKIFPFSPHPIPPKKKQ